MNDQRTPLEEFEFRQAARIRTPEEKREKPTPQKKRVFLTVLLLVLLAGALFAAGFLYHQLQLQQLKTTQLAKELATSKQKMTETEISLKDIQQKLKKMTHRVSDSSKGKGELLTAIEQLNQSIDTRNKEIQSLKQKIREREKSIENAEKARKKMKTELKKAQKSNQDLKSQVNTAKATIREFQDTTGKLKSTIRTLQSNMNQEGNASRKLVSDMLDAQSKAEKLRKEKESMEETIDSLRKENTSLKRVDPGELVPFSDLVTPAKPIVHPSATLEKKGSFGKVRGFIVVNAYIDETGFVQNAFYLESHLRKDEKNGAAISQALKTVLKWRFSPALYNDKTPVKIWQPVVIPINSK